MIPILPELTDSFQPIEYQNNTYRMVGVDNDYYVMSGYADEVDALIQTILIILSTERYAYPIYSWDFGIELIDLFGKPISFVVAELPRRITEALTQDNRITDCSDFSFTKNRNKLLVMFTVKSIYGDVSMTKEVTL